MSLFNKLIAVVVCVVALTTVVPINSVAADRIYEIGYSEGAPFHFLAIERLRLVYNRAGLEFRFIALPTKRSLVTANYGSIDGDAARVPSIARKYKNLRRVDVKLIDLRGVAYTDRKDIKKYDEGLLAKYRIGYVLGVQWAEKKLKAYGSLAAPDHSRLFKMLKRDRFDIVFATEVSGDAVIREKGGDAYGIVKLQPPIFSTETYHYVHKKNASIIPKLEAALRSIRDEGIWSN